MIVLLSMLRKKRSLVAIFSIIFTALFSRFYNLNERLYFIYDQGRDALKLKEMLAGDLTLVGPTTGLSGFFLGPLWYYLGLPGFFITSGNPYLLAVWFILLALMAIPGWWMVSQRLFSPTWALLSFALLTLVPGSIHWGTFIWNPLISIPLLTYTLYAFFKAQTSRAFLILGFFLLALILQSEFAYAIFLIVPLWLLIPWIRQEINWRDFLGTSIAIGVTFIPQFVFELRNNFLLVNQLLKGTAQNPDSITWLQLWQHRPADLWQYSTNLMLGYTSNLFLLSIPLLLVLGLGWLLLLRKLSLTTLLHPSPKLYQELLLWLFFALPYLGFMFWKGNFGNFFDYYLTPHFILICLLLVRSMQQLWDLKNKQPVQYLAKSLVVVTISILIIQTSRYIYTFVLHPNNQAGLQAIDQAVEQLYSWSEETGDPSSNMLVFTSAYQNEQYDYLIWWKAQQRKIAIPISVRQADQKNWFLLIERNQSDISKFRFAEWYPVATADGILKERKQIGILELEWWQQASTSEETANN